MQLISRRMHRWFDQIAGLATFFYRLILTVTQAFQDSRFALFTSGKLRRFWLVHFQKGYVQRQLPARQGDCHQCGTCCNLLFTCPMLTKQGRCFVYDFCRPKVCKIFPIDQRDIDEVKLCSGQYGYRFNLLHRHFLHSVTPEIFLRSFLLGFLPLYCAGVFFYLPSYQSDVLTLIN